MNTTLKSVSIAFAMAGLSACGAGAEDPSSLLVASKPGATQNCTAEELHAPASCNDPGYEANEQFQAVCVVDCLGNIHHLRMGSSQLRVPAGRVYGVLFEQKAGRPPQLPFHAWGTTRSPCDGPMECSDDRAEDVNVSIGIRGNIFVSFTRPSEAGRWWWAELSTGFPFGYSASFAPEEE